MDHPARVLPIFRHGLGFFEQLKLRLGWKVICRLMTKGMDLGSVQREESRDLLEQELDWLDSLLADGRPFLTGDSLTRADIAAASLLAPVAPPSEHPEYERVVVPPLAKAKIAGWRDRPSINHTLAVYKKSGAGHCPRLLHQADKPTVVADAGLMTVELLNGCLKH